MLGKEKCRILKEIRQRIADENDIPYVTRECSFQGSCRGTCPKCESELRYLEEQLALRQSLGKRVAVTALCAAMAFASAGCGPSKTPTIVLPGGTPAPVETDISGMIAPPPTEEPLMGEAVPWEDEDPPEETEEPLAGEVELTGDVAWVPEDPPVENGNG